eukprot:Opistho-2@66209
MEVDQEELFQPYTGSPALEEADANESTLQTGNYGDDTGDVAPGDAMATGDSGAADDGSAMEVTASTDSADSSQAEILKRLNRIKEYSKQRYSNKMGAFATGFDVTSQEEVGKRQNRAARFGIDVQSVDGDAFTAEVDMQKSRRAQKFGSLSSDVSEVALQNPQDVKKVARAERFGIIPQAAEPAVAEVFKTKVLDVREPPRQPKPDSVIRREALHIYGTDSMSTKDILAFFREYGPSYVEWINDSSCNVVWEDIFSSARVLLRFNDKTVIPRHDPIIEPRLAEASQSGVAGTEDIASAPTDAVVSNAPLPDELQWRKAINPKNGLELLVRLATIEDIKVKNAAERSIYYALHGRNGPGGNRKRRSEEMSHENGDGSEEAEGNRSSKRRRRDFDKSRLGARDQESSDGDRPKALQSRGRLTRLEGRLGARVEPTPVAADAMSAGADVVDWGVDRSQGDGQEIREASDSNSAGMVLGEL